jgi:hypothetical protein
MRAEIRDFHSSTLQPANQFRLEVKTAVIRADGQTTDNRRGGLASH